MALTNAERQARFKAKARARVAELERRSVALAEAAETFRQACQRQVGSSAPTGDLSGLLAALMDGDRAVRGLQGPLLAQALGLPEPWPGLTRNDLSGMIGRRTREAARLGLPVGLSGAETLDFATRLKAEQCRDWLVGGVEKMAT